LKYNKEKKLKKRKKLYILTDMVFKSNYKNINNEMKTSTILQTITLLDCSEYPLLTSIPYLPNLTMLNCSHINITSIPFLPNLTMLNCSHINITSIPFLPNLTSLFCTNTNITSIPVLPKLTRLICSDCTLLTDLPVLPNLTRLICSDCTLLTDLPILPKLTRLICTGCKWLPLLNKDYKKNIDNLIIVQRWFKTLQTVKKIKAINKELAPYYWHPDAHGGYIHKKNMLEYIKNNITNF